MSEKERRSFRPPLLAWLVAIYLDYVSSVECFDCVLFYFFYDKFHTTYNVLLVCFFDGQNCINWFAAVSK